MKNHLFFCLLLTGFLLASCGDDDATTPDPEPPTTIDTILTEEACFLLFDENGQAIGTHGECTPDDLDEQWENTALDAAQRAYLTFADTLPSGGPGAVTIDKMAVYPNPVGNTRFVNLYFFSDQTEDVKIKLALVDQAGTARFQTAIFGPAGQPVTVLLPEDALPLRQPYRLYYQVLGQDDETVLFEGYGNLLLCDGSPVTEIGLQCF